MQKRLKIFLACAIGAGIGTAVALQLAPYFWWIGIIIGGLTGYLSYEIREVKSAIRKAWQWQPSKEKKEKTKWLLLGSMSIASTGTSMAWIIAVPIILAIKGIAKWQNVLSEVTSNAIVYSFFWTFLLSLFYILDGKTIEELKERAQMHPVKFYGYFLPKVIKWLIKKTPAGMVFFGRFVKKVFLLIHSEVRLLCGLDAAIGTVIGYFAGNVIIGTLVGGLIGVLNYEILSKRVLRLVPLAPVKK